MSWKRDRWGRYEPAIRRWEATTGRAAPFPAERGRTGNFRLSPAFAEWMFGITGWVTGVAGLPYYAQVRALGNGVVPAQAAAALRLLIRVATMPGTRLSADLPCPHEKSADAAGPGRKASRVRAPSASAVSGRPAPTVAARAPQPQAKPEGVSVAANPSSARNRRRAA